MTTPALSTSTETPGFDTSLQAQLAAHLPGLPDPDLCELVAQVRCELERRVGSALSEGLTDAQLEEFEALSDQGDDAGCARWLHTNKPDYRATVAVKSSRLIAEVVETLATADPEATRGAQSVAQTYAASLQLIEDHLTTHDMKYHHAPNGCLRAAFSDDDRWTAAVLIDLCGKDKNVFAFRAGCPDTTFLADAEPVLRAWADAWNRGTWTPKAVVITDVDTGTCRVFAESVVPAGGGLTRGFVDAMMRHWMSSMFRFFTDLQDEVGHLALPPDSDAA
jgi:hypothetical protein